jgi:hypothetical protein
VPAFTIRSRSLPHSAVFGIGGSLSGYTVTGILVGGVSTANLAIGAQNAGALIGAITVTTSPPSGPQNYTITLSGADAADFAVSNGGVQPCNLIVGPSDLAAGSYAITLTAS